MPVPRHFVCWLLWLGAASGAAADPAIAPPRPWEPDAFLPVTAARIAARPAGEQPAWLDYWKKSTAHARPATVPTDPLENAPKPLATGQPVPSVYSRGHRLDAPADWYATADARTIADHVATWQTSTGGWTKGGDYTRARQPADDHHDDWSLGTFDNDATTHELRFLALVLTANPSAEGANRWREAFLRGLAYIFVAQYPNGGFPQIYPLVGGYHDAITFNDDAMVQILEQLRDIAGARPPYRFVPPDLAAAAGTRVARGIQCILDSQLRDTAGRRTIWGQQHDALTLQPCAARNFEPVSACSLESVSLARFLMTIPSPSPEIIAAVEGAVAWFPPHALPGVIWDRDATTGTGLVPKPDAPALWARFYELGTNRPIFSDRDRMVHYTVTELSLERRKGYGWYNTRATTLPAAYATWRAQLPAK
jgi:PelA/Pel-15E family pectate lyase